MRFRIMAHDGDLKMTKEAFDWTKPFEGSGLESLSKTMMKVESLNKSLEKAIGNAGKKRSKNPVLPPPLLLPPRMDVSIRFDTQTGSVKFEAHGPQAEVIRNLRRFLETI